ncbi:hypothetical protein WUBG_01458 [Wuchereria bancrofti]|uniref:Uncharacterized protein n=1 Tax=Wuchereria bancrofti TaxID=6293 RepID=J9BJQ6_WUCBA|nr:hypothetical protein WUBG_01458 [Wuchereria bancrofti]
MINIFVKAKDCREWRERCCPENGQLRSFHNWPFPRQHCLLAQTLLQSNFLERIKMTSGPGNYDEAVVVFEDSNDSFTMSDEQNNHRVILESHSFIEAGSTADDNRGPEQPHYRAARVIWSSDEEADDDNVNKKRRRKPSDNGDVGSHICFEFKIVIIHCVTSNGIEDDETNS